MTTARWAAAAAIAGAIALSATVASPALAVVPELGTPYPGDAEAEARLVAVEDERIIAVENLITTAARENLSQHAPYRLATAPTPTLVLVGRTNPYTMEELATIAPRSVVIDADGSFLVSENIVIADGATLEVRSGEGATVRLSSGTEGFVSMIAIGGALVVEGDPDSPVSVSSWNPVSGAVDSVTTDGRAYIRILGGRALLSNASFANLGFWSGVTGGLSLTGVDPSTDTSTATALEEFPEASGTDLEGEILPADGGLETLSLESDADTYGYSSALIQNVTLDANAFGLFVTKSDRVEVRSTLITNSLVDGLIFHREVTNSRVIDSVATNNARDGLRITRATSSVSFERVTATHNGRNGISLEGGPLADGPNAIGVATTVYGNNQVFEATSSDNGRYGIDVVGGSNLNIAGNTVSRNQMGIVVSDGATGVVIADNLVTDSASQGIAVRDAGLDAAIRDNIVLRTEIGIYLRDAGATIEGNTIDEVSNHGVTLIGATGASVIAGNTISGSGPSAIDVARTSGSAVRGNITDGWRSTKPIEVVLQGIFQPLTILWLTIAVVIVFASIFHSRRSRGIHDPFAGQAPLSSMTRGIVPRDQLGSHA